MTTQTLPRLPLLPLKNVAIFPELIQALIVGRPASLAAVKVAIDQDRKLVTVLQKDRDQENPDREGLFDIGTLATVTRVEQRDGGAQVIVRGVRRVRVHALSAPTAEDAPAEVEVVELPTPVLPEDGEDRAKAAALIRENLDIARQVAHIMSQNPDQLFQQMVGSIEDPVTQMYRLVELARNIEQNDKQRILEIDDIQPFLEAIHRLLRQELAVVEMQRDLQSQAREEAEHGQREHLLRQQKRVIEEALGEDGDDEDIAELRKQLRNVNLPDDVRKEVDRELKRLSRMSANAADYQVSRGYLELVAELPWNVITEDTLDLANAQAVLDEDHYGLEEVKERILESLAVLRLNPDAKASILCFVGPPWGRQDVVGSVHRPCHGAQVRTHEPRRTARRIRTARPSEDLYRGHAGAHPAGRPTCRRAQPGADARRSGQARPRLPRRPCGGIDGDSGSRAEPRVPRQLPEPAIRSLEGDLHHHGEPLGRHPETVARPHGSARTHGLQRDGEARNRPALPDSAPA